MPVGAVFVVADEVVAHAGNHRERSGDPTAHAEILALRAASLTIGNWRLAGELFVTQEPCPMCAGAIVNARVTRLVYGCANPKAGAVDTLFEIATDSRLNHRVEVTRGVLREQCAAVLQEFFANLRRGVREVEGA